jgi:hypothetical protein
MSQSQDGIDNRLRVLTKSISCMRSNWNLEFRNVDFSRREKNRRRTRWWSTRGSNPRPVGTTAVRGERSTATPPITLEQNWFRKAENKKWCLELRLRSNVELFCTKSISQNQKTVTRQVQRLNQAFSIEHT